MVLIWRLSRRSRPNPRSEPAPDTPPPARRRMISVAEASAVAMREAISLIKDSSDAFPPLKSVAGGLNAIDTMVEVSLIAYRSLWPQSIKRTTS